MNVRETTVKLADVQQPEETRLQSNKTKLCVLSKGWDLLFLDHDRNFFLILFSSPTHITESQTWTNYCTNYFFQKNNLGNVSSWRHFQHFLLKFLDIPCWDFRHHFNTVGVVCAALIILDHLSMCPARNTWCISGYSTNLSTVFIRNISLPVMNNVKMKNVKTTVLSFDHWTSSMEARRTLHNDASLAVWRKDQVPLIYCPINIYPAISFCLTGKVTNSFSYLFIWIYSSCLNA